MPLGSFSNPIIGTGGVLVRTLMRSQNFVPGVSGWAIYADGDAQFNGLTITGTFMGVNFLINSLGEFFYSPSPGPGNLLISIADAAGTDKYGNPYPMGMALHNVGGTGLIQLRPDLSALLFYQ